MVHWELIEEHGGTHGIRDEDLIESALARPRHKWVYQEEVDLPDLAAAYGYGLTKNHGYFDGNKRVAFFSLVLFLRRNGLLRRAPQDQVVQMMEELSGGGFGIHWPEIDEDLSSEGLLRGAPAPGSPTATSA